MGIDKTCDPVSGRYHHRQCIDGSYHVAFYLYFSYVTYARALRRQRKGKVKMRQEEQINNINPRDLLLERIKTVAETNDPDDLYSLLSLTSAMQTHSTYRILYSQELELAWFMLHLPRTKSRIDIQ